MGELTLTGLDGDVLEKLGRRAAEHGRSVEDEVADILREKLEIPSQPSWMHTLEVARRQTAGTIRSHSLDLIREGRDDLA